LTNLLADTTGHLKKRISFRGGNGLFALQHQKRSYRGVGAIFPLPSPKKDNQKRVKREKSADQDEAGNPGQMRWKCVIGEIVQNGGEVSIQEFCGRGDAIGRALRGCRGTLEDPGPDLARWTYIKGESRCIDRSGTSKKGRVNLFAEEK